LFHLFNPILEKLKLFEAFASNDIATRTVLFPCMYSSTLCDIGMLRIATTTSEFHDEERSKAFFGHYPAGSSFRIWQHIY
jgi:hypothetical protein